MAPHVGVIRPEDTSKLFGCELLHSDLHVVAVFIYTVELLAHMLNMFQCQF